jgi:hypothetical protein
MGIKEYIKGKLQNLIDKFPTSTVRYGYNPLSCTHIIEVTPLSLFNSDEFRNWEAEFYKESLKEYPDCDIAFLSDDAYIGLFGDEEGYIELSHTLPFYVNIAQSVVIPEQEVTEAQDKDPNLETIWNSDDKPVATNFCDINQNEFGFSMSIENQADQFAIYQIDYNLVA